MLQVSCVCVCISDCMILFTYIQLLHIKTLSLFSILFFLRNTCSPNDCFFGLSLYHQIIYIHVNLTYIPLSSWNSLSFLLFHLNNTHRHGTMWSFSWWVCFQKMIVLAVSTMKYIYTRHCSFIYSTISWNSFFSTFFLETFFLETQEFFHLQIVLDG